MKFWVGALMSLMLMLASTATVGAEVYHQDVVYVIYQTEGEDAVPNVDVNDNGVPDMVEDTATQINAARKVFHDVFDFPDPLKSKRYSKIKSIEVVVTARKSKGNGVAYSSPHNKSRRDPNENVLLIKVVSDLKNTNSTPAHEYFHLIQYGTSWFSNPWYLEGMARWSQDAVAEIKKYPNGKNMSWTLKDKASEAKIFEGKYNVAKLLWYPLAVALDDKQKIPDSLVKKYRYADGSPVFKDNVFYGPNVMRQIMLMLPSKEEQAAEEFGGRSQWRKKGRRNPQNNKYILECVRAVYNERK